MDNTGRTNVVNGSIRIKAQLDQEEPGNVVEGGQTNGARLERESLLYLCLNLIQHPLGKKAQGKEERVFGQVSHTAGSNKAFS